MQGMSVDLSMSVKDRIDCIRRSMEAILLEYRQGKNPPIFTLRDQALGLCKAKNLVRKQHLSSRYVVVHPRNRYGDGIVPEHVHALVDGFANNGYPLPKTGSPFSSEVPPHTNPRFEEVR